jgi:hypothetical protein
LPLRPRSSGLRRENCALSLCCQNRFPGRRTSRPHMWPETAAVPGSGLKGFSID